MLDDLFWIKPLLKTLVLPPTSLLLLALAGFAASTRFPRVGKMIAAAATLGLLALSLPAVATALSQLLQPPKPFALADAKGAQAIVILGGGARHYAADYGGGDTLAPLTLERVRYGARVARLTGLPILVSGGAQQWGTPEADLMRDALEREYEIPVRWSERQSRNTHQNAVLSAAILRQAHMNRVILVTHGVDMLRATAEFSAQGIDVVPAATGLSTRHAAALIDWIPGMSALQASYHAVYEIFGNIAMRMALIR